LLPYGETGATLRQLSANGFLSTEHNEVELATGAAGTPGRMDFKAMTLFRDGYRCRQCGTRVTHETSETDHIKPVSRFASYAQATTLLNLQTLCLECHKIKTHAK
jgi:hypothetical protein